MNFADEVRSFVDWIEINPLEPTTQALWMHLMNIANKSGYPEWFTVTNPLLIAKLGVSENAMTKHRNYLIQRGRIEYKGIPRVRGGKYRLIPLSASNNEVDRAAIRCAGIAADSAANGLPYINNLSSTTSSSSGESFYAAHDRVFKFNCSDYQAGLLGSYIGRDGLEESVVIRAIERAGEKSIGYNFDFIKRILDDYFKGGARTLRQAIALDHAFEARKQQTSGGGGAKPPQRPLKRSFAEIGRGMTGEQ